MKENRKDKSSELPTVSGPAPDQEGAFSVPPPQIEGYEIVGELGQAGQGRVWRAMQLSTRREVALKVPLVDLLSSRKALARFEREVELAARLKHPNIARIYDSGIYQGLYYYAMELIEGTTLDDYVERHSLTQRQILELMRTICQAVQHAHQNGVIHRDIKSSNIIVTEDGQPHIVDFGLAMTILEDDTFKTISIEGEVAGTPAYMSPEQAAGLHEQLDTRTDVYSIGVVFYKVLTNNFPYDVESSMLHTLRNIQETEPAKPSKLMPSLDLDVEAIVLKALAKEPDDRYQSVAGLQHDIECWLNGLPVSVRSDSSIYLLRKVIARHRYTSTVVGLLLVIILGFSCLSFQLYVGLRQSNTKLQETVQSLNQQLEEYMNLAQRASITRFLEAWHENQWEDARVIARFFGRETKEAETAHFLLDQRSLSERTAEFRQRLPQSELCFGEFIIAEHHYKDKNWQEAIKAYQRCLSYDDYLKDDKWLAAQVQSRLFELTENDHNTETSSVVKEDES
jgi:serine/threonine protein kinase